MRIGALDTPIPFASQLEKDVYLPLNQIEGKVSENQKIVVIEDLISTGKSSLNAVKALRESNLEVLGMIATVSYTHLTLPTKRIV